LAQQLQQKIAQLEAQLAAAPAKEQRIQDKGNWRKLQKGMTRDDVSNLLGQSEKVSTNTSFIMWYWDNPAGAEVQFDANLIWSKAVLSLINRGLSTTVPRG
jgi:hypothetical protein